MTFRIDRYGRTWNLPDAELCSECGQPDSCDDCNHEPLSNDDVALLRGISNNEPFPLPPLPVWLT